MSDLRQIIEKELMKERYQRLDCLEMEGFNFSFCLNKPIFPKNVDTKYSPGLVFCTTWQDYFILLSQGNNQSSFNSRLEREILHQND